MRLPYLTQRDNSVIKHAVVSSQESPLLRPKVAKDLSAVYQRTRKPSFGLSVNPMLECAKKTCREGVRLLEICSGTET